MARRKKISPIKQILIVASSLIVIQVGYILYFKGSTQTKSVREAIKTAVSKRNELSAGRRDQLALQLAAQDFMAKHGGKPPESLATLVPTYFDSVPIDPDTGKPFEYRVDGARFFVGSSESQTADKSKQKGASDAEGPSEAEQKLLIASLDQKTEPNAFVYDPTGKREPFRPFDFAPKAGDLSGKTPLERYEIGQLKLTAVLGDAESATAIVENEAGRGFTVRIGTKIGVNSGEVVEIRPDRLLILETSTDFTGQTKTNTVEMKLRIKDTTQDNQGANTRR